MGVDTLEGCAGALLHLTPRTPSPRRADVNLKGRGGEGAEDLGMGAIAPIPNRHTPLPLRASRRIEDRLAQGRRSS
jgi:hypothetical protein